MFQSQVRFPVVVSLDYDPAADKNIPIWRAPMPCTIKAAYAMLSTTVAASTANYFQLSLLNGGASGSGSDTIAGAIGGTVGWTAGTPYAFTISDGKLEAGEVVLLKYDEEGTGTFGQVTVQLDVVYGI